LLNSLGLWKVVILIFVVVSMVLSPVLYGIYWVWKRLQDLHRKRIEELGVWTADEEIEGLLDGDDEEEGYDNVGKEGAMLKKGEDGGGSGTEKPLPPPPVPPKAGEDSHS
jgi:hypothetical protein